MTLAVVFALAAAFSSAVNLMTQHAASISAPEREKGWRLVLYLARQPLWLLGWAAAAGTFVFQARTPAPVAATTPATSSPGMSCGAPGGAG